MRRMPEILCSIRFRRNKHREGIYVYLEPKMKILNLKRWKALPVILAVTVICFAVVFAGLTVFRPQVAALYRKAVAFFTVSKNAEYAHYRDEDGQIVIRVDPGHGGSDPGAVSDFLGEFIRE